MNFLAHTLLATTLVGTSPISSQAVEGSISDPSEQSHYRADVIIDTTALQHDEFPETEIQRQQDLFERDLPAQFLEVGAPETGSEDAARVRVLFRWDDFNEFRYGVTFEVTTPDGQVREHAIVFQGDEHDLIERLKDEVPAVIALLERPPTPQETTPPPSAPADPQQPLPPPNRPQGRGLLWTGVGLTIVGAALLPTGIVLHMQTDERNDGLTRVLNQRRHPVALTGTLIGVGAAALGAGVPLIIVGAKKGKPSKKRAQLTPSASPNHVGFSLHGRF